MAASQIDLYTVTINLEGRYCYVPYTKHKTKAHRVCDLPGVPRGIWGGFFSLTPMPTGPRILSRHFSVAVLSLFHCYETLFLKSVCQVVL